MRAVRYHETGGPEVLTVEDVDRPDPGGSEVRVRVEVAGVNPVDTYFREGSYRAGPSPMTPGADFAGVVDAVGEDVAEFDAGDRVFGTGLGREYQGTYAEYCVAPTDRVAHLPDGVTFAEGAAVALVGVTAWRALVDHAALQPAERCLVHGGSGGVGHVAVQLAATTGATVVTTARPDYHERLFEYGADHVFDYAREDLEAAVREVGRCDVVLDHRMDEYLGFDAAVAAPGARVVCIGNTDTDATLPNVPAARAKELTVSLMSMYNTPDLSAVLERLAVLLASGAVVPDVARHYALSEAAAAQRAVMEESYFGKLLVEP